MREMAMIVRIEFSGKDPRQIYLPDFDSGMALVLSTPNEIPDQLFRRDFLRCYDAVIALRRLVCLAISRNTKADSVQPHTPISHQIYRGIGLSHLTPTGSGKP